MSSAWKWKRMTVVAGLGLATLAGCDPNPGGPTFPDKPVAQDGADAPGSPAAKKKGRGGPNVLINDPAK